MIVMTRDTAVPATAGDPFAELFQPAAPIFDAVMNPATVHPVAGEKAAGGELARTARPPLSGSS
jgi:hypothetical protein